MIKKIKKARSKKVPLLLGAVIVIALICGGVYWYSQTKSANDQQPTQKQKSEAQTPNPKDSSNKVSSGSNGNGSVPIPPEPAPTNPNAALSISSFSQTNHVIQAVATITNAPGGGSCYFAFSSTGSKPVVQSATSSASGSTQSCTFSSSDVAFDKIGSWQLQVTYTAGGAQVEGSQNVTIQ